ncbi:DNA -binding domain-containing protein [Sphingobium sp. TomTYG45]
MPGFPHHRWPGDQAYRYLEDIGPTGLAWEWLRRDPAYRRLEPAPHRMGRTGVILIEHAAHPVVTRWGCLNVENSTLPAPDGAILWSSALDPSILRCLAVPAAIGQAGAFNLELCGEKAVVVKGGAGAEHILIGARPGGLRIDLLEGTLLQGPVMLRYDFSAADDIEPSLTTLRAFHHLCRMGKLSHRAIKKRQRDRRVVDALRTHDALQAGASIRDVGILLFGAGRVAEEWGAPGEALKSQCRRMIALARRMAGGGYRCLLQSKTSRHT